MSHAECPECPSIHRDVAHLRAEVERLNREREIVQNEQRLLTCVFCGQEYPPGTPTQNHQDLADHVSVCEKHPAAQFRRERDEALAQVAFYAKEIAECSYTYEDAYSLLKRLGRIDIPVQVRALLDRLQRAEAVVEAVERCEAGRGAFSCYEPHDCRCPKSRADSHEKWKGEWICECGREQLDSALTAWEEERA